MYSYSNDNKIRRNVDGAEFLQIDGLLAYEEYKLWIASGNHPPAKTQQQIAKELESAVDRHIDSVAASRGYGRIGIQPSASCIGYASYPSQWQAEAIAFGRWVADCQVKCIQVRADVTDGILTTIPTEDELIAELPVMVWPA